MRKNILTLFLLLLLFMSTKANSKDSLLNFQKAAEVYSDMNKRISMTHTAVPSYVKGVLPTKLSLDGEWMFNPSIGSSTHRLNPEDEGWSILPVPSEWYMHGHKVKSDEWAGYIKDFILPEEWHGNDLIIRFGAVQSKCVVYLNGTKVGEHIGSMTQFEMDVTPYAVKGKNRLSLYVQSDSKSELSARISQYAKHQVGGIIRSVELIVVPKKHIQNCFIDALLDSSLKKGVLNIDASFSEKTNRRDMLKIVVREKGVEGISHRDGKTYKREFSASQKEIAFQIENPKLWHAESPFLYTVEINYYSKGELIETIEKNVGFRRIEIKGNLLYVNNKPVKLRGVARHDMSAYDGRAVVDTASLRRDVEQLRNANCNFVRTAHYPPHEYLLELCDRYGLFVEDEAPVCWDRNPNTQERADLLFYAFKSMFVRDRSHPCILLWSVANESNWDARFYPCLLLAEDETPHIPVKFSHSEFQGIKKRTHIGAKHYPGWQGIMRYDNYFRPMIFGEALHINCYNTSENITDPGLRDSWGDYLKYHVNEIQESPAIAGVGIWSAIDEMFYPARNAPCGYGPWGVVDGFKREKPEFWHMKMSYSPVVVTSKHFQTNDSHTLVMLENRYNVLNTSSVCFKWQDGQIRGEAQVNILPMEQGVLAIPHKMLSDTLYLYAYDARGFEIARWLLPRKYSPHYEIPSLSTKELSVDDSSEKELRILAAGIAYRFSKQTGELLSIEKNGKLISNSGVQLYLIPLLKQNEVIDFIPQDSDNRTVKFTSEPLKEWIFKSFEKELVNTGYKITTRGELDGNPVEFIYLIDGEGTLRIEYMVNINKVKYGIRQLGIGLNLADKYYNLKWNRKGLWSYYPNDHIGRNSGDAKAFYKETNSSYLQERTVPSHPYKKDGNEFGSNDFRSTKHNIINAELIDDKGNCVYFYSNGRQHLRAWVIDGLTHFLLANYSNAGNEYYLTHASSRTKYSLNADKGDVAGWMQIKFK